MNAAQQMFREADAIQRKPITAAQRRNLANLLAPCNAAKDTYDAEVAEVSAISGESKADVRLLAKTELDGTGDDLIDKLQGTIDLLGSFAGGGDSAREAGQ